MVFFTALSPMWPEPGVLMQCAQAKRGLTGIMNYTNPGAISHNEILELYKCYVDGDFAWSNFSVEEQAKVIVAPRSNNLLDTARVRAGALPLLCPSYGWPEPMPLCLTLL